MTQIKIQAENPEQNQTETTEREERPDRPWEAATFFGWLFSQTSFDRGDLASLRRMDPESPVTTAYWRLMNHKGLLSEDPRPRLERKWAVIMKSIAIMSRNAPPVLCAHDRNISVGQALYGPRRAPLYSERKVERFLRVRDDTFYEAVISFSRAMRAANASMNWGEMARLILGEGMNEVASQRARTNIARDYFRAQAMTD